MFDCSSSVTTVYPIEEYGYENGGAEETRHTTRTLDRETIPPTQSFFPTVAVIQNSLESLHKPETHTFLPFIPDVLPEVAADSAAAETPSAGSWEHTEGTAEEPEDVRMLETVTGRGHGGEAELEEHLTAGKTPSNGFI